MTSKRDALLQTFEKSRGNSVAGGPRNRSFDLTVVDGGSEIHCEVKGMAPGETWVGINALGWMAHPTIPHKRNFRVPSPWPVLPRVGIGTFVSVNF